jgi:ADP-L-glycero-D-manno-heptose 6-epimerase
MIVVTGGAGFIGSCAVAKLNELGFKDLIVVDHLNHPLKEKNLTGKKFVTYLDKREFIDEVVEGKLNKEVKCIIHMGACSSTTLQDAPYFEENNFQYTLSLAKWSLAHDARFIYASSAATYGDGSIGYKDDDESVRKCRPLNLYGQSKQKFDEWVLENKLTNRFVGLKFFNVFGPNEYHKGEMRSVVAKAYKTVVEEMKMKLFRSDRPEYKDGEQKRDFIYVKDAVDVILYFFKNNVNGIFNVGTGKARSWNDLAKALFAAVKIKPDIEYCDMPLNLKGKYQYFTQADMTKLIKSGYTKSFTSLEDAVKDYAGYLKTESCM